eukprot:1284579-Rhodomonas_salina.1
MREAAESKTADAAAWALRFAFDDVLEQSSTAPSTPRRSAAAASRAGPAIASRAAGASVDIAALGAATAIEVAFPRFSSALTLCRTERGDAVLRKQSRSASLCTTVAITSRAIRSEAYGASIPY